MNLKLLAAKREEKGLTQEQMGNYLGYKSKSSYCMMENGKIKITIEAAKKIKNILQLTNKEFNTIFFNDKVQDNTTNQAV